MLWLELFQSAGNLADDEHKIRIFFERAEQYGLDDHCALICYRPDEPVTLEKGDCFGKSRADIGEFVKTSDLLWNFACAYRQPLLSQFKHPVLIDSDPGHLQVSALDYPMDLYDHRTFLTVGLNIHRPTCEIPTLGLEWHPFRPFVYMPLWPMSDTHCANAPFTSITHWTWAELHLNGRVLDVSKRAAYMRYLDLPRRVARRMQLAAYISPEDKTGDRELLTESGWELVSPWDVAGTPDAYREYITSSCAEIQCPKPIYCELRTGWFSDRSAAYLATGRPVLAEETGFSEFLPAGKGLLTFRTMDEAVAGVAEIDRNWNSHSRAARQIAQEYLGSDRCLSEMLAACGY